jgi:subtilisin family serine protease
VAPNGLQVTVFPDAYPAILESLKQMGATVAGQEPSPFGPLLKVNAPPGTLADLASLPGVQAVARSYGRHQANDLTRTELGVSADQVVLTNYLGLTGAGVMVSINDRGVDASHPDLTGRIFGGPLTDASGHGTHVAGTILGSGTNSATVLSASGSPTNANFRGMAPGATALALPLDAGDFYLQETAAATNILISNNSWNSGDAAYDIQAASYDAAVRDALPLVPGSQPLLFVF